MNIRVRTNAGATLDPQRLRYLTENFSTLQGLNLVALGAISLLTPLAPIGDVYGVTIRWWFLLVMAALSVPMRYIERYYRRRFGWVEPRNPSNKQIAIFFLALVVLFLCRHSLDRFTGDLTQVIHSMISDPDGRIELLPLVGWIVALFASFLKRSQRVADPYWIYFLCSGTSACAVVAFYPLWHPEAAQSLVWRTLNAGSFGFSLMALGLYNHITLVRMLPKRFVENDDE